MNQVTLTPLPITAERFAPYGDVIATGLSGSSTMNDARFDRFSNLATVDIDSAGEVAIGIVRSKSPTLLPYHFDMVERHPNGSQAFIPLGGISFLVVVAPPGESVEPEDLRAFVTNGNQGINYRRGTWHMPLISMGEGEEFLVVDRVPGDGNCEERVFDQPVVLQRPA